MLHIGDDIYAITAAIIWGLNYPLAKLVLESVPETDFLTIRFTATVIILLMIMMIYKQGVRIEGRDYLRILTLGALGVGLYNIVWTCGIHQTTAANAALLISTSPIFTGIYAVITKQERINVMRWIGTLVAFLGVFCIIRWTSESQFDLSSDVFWGNLLVLIGSGLFSLYGIISKPLLNKYTPMELTTFAMTSGLPFLILYSVYNSGMPDWSTVNITIGLEMTYIVVLGTIAAFILWYKGIKQTNPVKTLLYHFIVPVLSIVFSAIIFGDRLSTGQLLGAILVFAGLVTVKIKPEHIIKNAGYTIRRLDKT